ncbi:MAG: UDP-N-acetylmuramoyl-tripeptide--D-alanyl-D-alanine ligase [Clostridia bacterium]|nr:UDP-N-acetylmuramoyl-tripeptide--D-alanyl-D-alanine ligase [Clostridia bacterium]
MDYGFMIILAAMVPFLIRQWQQYLKFIHMLQLEGYKNIQYIKWINKNTSTVFLFNLFYSAVVVVLGYIVGIFGNIYIIYTFIAAWFAFNLLLVFRYKPEKVKKQLVFTARVKRLLFTVWVLLIAFLALFFMLLTQANYVINVNMVYFIIIASIFNLLAPFIVLAANTVNFPVEWAVKVYYFKSAQDKIKAMSGLKVVGITGSYGKTSTKFILGTILSQKYNVLVTPESYNTPMGITKVIREQLDEGHEIFVTEMGARHIGDIKTLCDLVSPEVGIITSIGPQHLETFKTIENIKNTKYELIECLPGSGFAVFNGNNEYCLKLAENTDIDKTIFGTGNHDFDVKAENIKFGANGQEFDLVYADNRIRCRTDLLGLHNISNILAAVCAAIHFELSPEQIREGIDKIQPIPHRLQLMKGNNGITIIDDAFNSNPVGSKMALDVLKEFEGGNKIIITPGMVELGQEEYEYNRQFGQYIAQACDYAILVGENRSRPMLEGLKLSDYPQDRIFVVSSLDEAAQKLSTIAAPGDVVLFENDLPDNYNE